MVNCKTIVSALALSALAAAAPSPPAAGAGAGPAPTPSAAAEPGLGKRFSLDLHPVKRGPAHPAARSLHTLDRYGGRVSKKLRSLANPQTGSVNVTSYPFYMQYHMPVKLGNSNMTLMFDTGNSDLWVTINETQGRGSHHPFDNSTCLPLPGYTFDISWGSFGDIMGNVCSDKVKVGGITSPKQAIQLALHMSEHISGSIKNDGVMGFGFIGLNTIEPTPQNTWFENVKNSLQQPVFTVDLRKDAVGTIDFGFVDPEKHSGSIFWAYVDEKSGFWRFYNEGYIIGNDSVIGDFFPGILDTGSNMILLFDPMVEEYYNKVPGAFFDEGNEGYVFPCNATLPNWTVIVEKGRFTVPGPNINFASVGSGLCYGGIQSNGGLPFAIYGNLFISQFLTIFGAYNKFPRVGFAIKA
uniref:Aspartic protease pep1 n=1 Tax=Talaromyces marneffei PM1 TaxID=1077442 RepID=A0A093UYP0_TALMA